MRVLVIGAGGREDALAWRLSQDDGVTVATCPGNPGSARWGENLSGPIEDAAERWRPDLIVIGPETPLADGIADTLRDRGFLVFGPGATGARLESSKAHAKEIMQSAGIPTARYTTVTDAAAARRLLADWGAPIVLKADGLAAGKGVTVARTVEEAEAAIQILFTTPHFGNAATCVVMEEFLPGEEASLLVLTDGKRFHILPSAEDHKAVFDGDLGPNTGGMGAISPTPVVTPAVLDKVTTTILAPLLPHLAAVDYRGVLYVGLMVQRGDHTRVEPRVVEFNCRFGDPETQAVLPRVEGPFAAALASAAAGQLDASQLRERPGVTACVMLASAGYPGDFSKGIPITGWDGRDWDVRHRDALNQDHRGATIFVSGASSRGDQLVTSGGRVLSVVGHGDSLDEARLEAYSAAEKITFDGRHFRRDIGMRRITNHDQKHSRIRPSPVNALVGAPT